MLNRPTALDRMTATHRGWADNRCSTYLQKLLGRDGLRAAIFPYEEFQLVEKAEVSLFHRAMSTIAVRKAIK